jgi:hypothetical protein
MTKAEKHVLSWNVREYLRQGLTDGIIVSRLMRMGYQKATIKKYITVFKSA